jgi:hypothetical protein
LKALLAAISTTVAGTAQAHSGHGLDGMLAHASSHGAQFILVSLAASLLAVLWAHRKHAVNTSRRRLRD